MTSNADPDPWNPYHSPGSGAVSLIGWIRIRINNCWIPNPEPNQIIWIRIQQIPLKTENNFTMLSIFSLIQMITGIYRTVIVKYAHKTWNMDVFLSHV